MVLKTIKSLWKLPKKGVKRVTSVNTEATSTSDYFDQDPLLVRIGGSKTLETLVATFLELVEADVTLIGLFHGVHPEVLSLHHKRFLSISLNKIPEYSSMRTMINSHHRHLFAQGLDESHFDLYIQHLAASMSTCNLSQEHIEEALAIVAPLRKIFEGGAKEAARVDS